MAGERILVVGEDPPTATKIERLLAQLGFRVVPVRHGAEGARLLRARGSDPIQLVVVVCPPTSCRALSAFLPKGPRPVPPVRGLLVGGPSRSPALRRLSSFEHEPLPLTPSSFVRHVHDLIPTRAARSMGRRGVVGSEGLGSGRLGRLARGIVS